MITALIFPLFSLHSAPPDPSIEYRQFNPGVIAEVDEKYLVGAYINSHDRLTILGVRHWTTRPIKGADFRIGALAGVCTGYKYPVCAAVTAKAGPIMVLYTPKMGDYNAHTLALAVEYRW